MWLRLLTRANYLTALGTVIAVAEVFFLGGRLPVLAFAALLFGLRWTLPWDEQREKREGAK